MTYDATPANLSADDLETFRAEREAYSTALSQANLITTSAKNHFLGLVKRFSRKYSFDSMLDEIDPETGAITRKPPTPPQEPPANPPQTPG